MSGSIKNISDLVAALEKIEKGKVLEKGSDLFFACQETFKRLQILDYFDPNDIPQIIIVFDNLPDELKNIDIGKLDYDAKKLESKALNKQDLESLVKDYEEAKDAAIKKVYEQEIYKRTGKKDVEQFVKTQKEIAERNIKILEKIEKIDPKLKGEIVTKLEKIEQGMEEVKAKKIEEMLLDEVETDKKKIEKEVNEIIKDKVKAKEISLEIIKEREEIKIYKKADEIAVKTCEELKQNQVVVTEEMRTTLREDILKSWKTGEKLIISEKITERVTDDVILKKTEKACENFKNENIESIIEYRAESFGKKVSYELRKNGVEDEVLIEKYVKVLQELNYSSDKVVVEVDTNEIVNDIFREIPKEIEFKVPPEVAVEEAKFEANNLPKDPIRFNKLIEDYREYSSEIKNIIGDKNVKRLNKFLGIKEIRVTEKLAFMFKDNPGMLKIFNGAQRTFAFLEKVNNFSGNLLIKMGAKDAGLKLLEKFGGKAAATFVKEAATVIAKEGTLNGIKLLANTLFSKGAFVVGGSTGTALTAALAAFQAIPVVGQVILLAVGAVMFLKSIIDGVKGIIGKITGLNMNGIKDFISDTLGLGKVAGSVGQFVGDVVGFVVGIPALIGMMAVGAIITPVIIFFFIGIFVSSLFQQGLISSVVPPGGSGNCVLKSEYTGDVNCDQNAPFNNVPGLKKDNFIRMANSWESGSNFSSVCYDDVVNRSLCAGVNPAYSLWMWLNESGASNYNRDDIEDFGIHFISENKNFNAQITKFLTLNPASACINDPRIGGNYWLALGANFMNGSDCNPDRPNSIFKSATPRKWLADFEKYWWEITSDPIPDSIFVPKSGKNCDSLGVGSTAYSGNVTEYTDAEGKVWLCTENTQSLAGGEGYNPNSPGLSGVKVDGECSVGEVVVPTKQCDDQWRNVTLNGGTCSNGNLGTICSAGCGPTSVSMLMRKVNGSLTPNNVIFNPGSAYANMGCEGSSLDQARSELVKKFGSGAVTYDATTLGCDEKAIAKWICDGKVVMVLANFYRNSLLELGGHYVMAVGVKNGKIVVRDPFYDTTDTPFDGTRAYGYAHDIRGCLLVDKNSVK